MESEKAQAVLAKKTDGKEESKRQPLWHVGVLNVLTCNGYSWIWFYKSWADLKKFLQKANPETQERIAPDDEQKKTIRYLSKMNVLIHALGLLPEYLNLFFAGLLFKQIADLYPKRQTLFARYSLLYAIICAPWLAWNMQNFSPMSPATYYRLFLGTIPLVVSQALLNEFWQSVEGENVYVRQAFSAGELLFIIMGAGLFGLILTGVMTNVTGMKL